MIFYLLSICLYINSLSIIISFLSTGSSSVSTLTDVTLTSAVSGNVLMYNGTSWVNSDTIPDNLFIVRDDIDGTKKFQIQCSRITAGQTRIMNAPDYSGNLSWCI